MKIKLGIILSVIVLGMVTVDVRAIDTTNWPFETPEGYVVGMRLPSSDKPENTLSNRISRLVGGITTNNSYLLSLDAVTNKFHQWVEKGLDDESKMKDSVFGNNRAAFATSLFAPLLSEHYGLRGKNRKMLEAKFGKAGTIHTVKPWPTFVRMELEAIPDADDLEYHEYETIGVWFLQGKVIGVTPRSSVFDGFVTNSMTIISKEKFKKMIEEVFEHMWEGKYAP